MSAKLMRIAGGTKVIGYVGATYHSSRVYELYNAIFPKLGIDYVYVPFAVEDIAAATRAVRALGIHGIGVTIPFKVSIIAHLDEIDERATRSGAVNVVTNRDGRLIGSNTDGLGAVHALKECIDPAGRRVLIVGSGGAARAIAAELTRAGALVCVIGIDEAEAEAVARETGCQFDAWEKLQDGMAAADILINATPVGTAGTPFEGQAALPGEKLHSRHVVMDIVTSPARTPLLRDAANSGCAIISGERMLLWQALLKFEIFTGQPADLSMMEAALRRDARRIRMGHENCGSAGLARAPAANVVRG